MSAPGAAGDRRRALWRLGFLFGAIYFLEGIGEPSEGLIAQPARSLLKRWGRSDSDITTFMALLVIPWGLKPLYGLLTDFVPIFGTRRKSYLVLSTGAIAVSMLALSAAPVRAGASATLFGWLMVSATAVAFADVATDALMIELSQPLALTGQLQAVQWVCLSAAGILTGLLGGELCEDGREYGAFLVCGIGGILTLALVLGRAREPQRIGPPPRLAGSLRALAGARSVLVTGAFLFLWHFNPFSNSVLYLHMTRALGFSERFYGMTVTLTAVVSVAASAAYVLYCRRVRMRLLVHASIALGVASTLAYVVVVDQPSAVLATLAASFTYMTATLIQLDLAAQVCPPETAGTVFALLMALENLSASLSAWLGGILYDAGKPRWGSQGSFQALVLISAALTAGCWLLVPWLPADMNVNLVDEDPSTGRAGGAGLEQ
jgi:MFS family permease